MATEPTAGSEAGFWRGLWPAAAGLAVLALLIHLTEFQEALGPVVLLRLRSAAVLIGVLPLLALRPGRHRFTRFLLARVRELALLGGGGLAALPLSYLLLRAVMPEAAASDYLARVLHLVVDPAPLMQTLADSPAVSQVLMKYVAQNSLLFFSTPVLALALALGRAVPRRLAAFIAVLVAGGLGVMLLLSRRHFTDHYGIFCQTPFLIAWALGLHGLLGGWPPAAARARWLQPAIAALALLVALAAGPRLRRVYDAYQSDAARPVSDLTLTFIFDHDAHTRAYLKIMAGHYGDRVHFAQALERYLADPANRP